MSIANMTLISNMGQGDVVVIDKPVEGIININTNAHVIIKNGTAVSFLDDALNANIEVTVEAGSVCKYLVLGGVNSKRTFNIAGELDMTEIMLQETNEELTIHLTSENANSNVKCLNIASKMSSTFKQYVSHDTPSTFSNIANVGVAMNNSTIIFDTTGKIVKGMNKSKCSQLSRGIVMDDNSVITAKPILLIDEFDCFANHGASIGKMSDEDLFYLMSRGLNKKEAFLLILKGIIHPFIASITVDEIKERIETEVSNLIES